MLVVLGDLHLQPAARGAVEDRNIRPAAFDHLWR